MATNAARLIARVVAHARQLDRGTSTPPAPVRAEHVLGFTYKPGQTAIDTVTGEEVTIYAGHPIADLVQSARPSLR